MSRRIRLRYVNLALVAVIVLLAIAYGRELRWAAGELPGYLDGSFSETPERQLYLRAAEILRDGDDIERALPLLEASLEIDPRGEAGFWLARYYELAGDDERALATYETYLATDPVIVQTYIQMARIHMRAGRRDAATEVLQRGLSYFEANAESYRPFMDRSASPEHNNKARQTHARYLDAAETLRVALERLASDPDPAGRQRDGFDRPNE